MQHKLVDPYENFKTITTKNGLTVYFLEVPQPWVSVRFLVHAGAKDDLLNKEGTAHFVEHQTSASIEGTTKTDFREHFYKIGGRYDLGSTGYENTSYKFSVPLENDNLEYGLNFFGKLLFQSSLDRDLERERKVIVEEYKERFPTQFVRDLLIKRRNIIFKGHKLANFTRPLGNLEAINSIKIEDLREFYDRCYTPKNITIVASGGMTIDEFVSSIENSALNIEKVGERIEKPAIIETISEYEEKHIHKSYKELLKDKPSQPDYTIYISLPGTVDNKVLNRALDVLSETLDEEIREKRGWAYGGDYDYHRFPEAYEVYGTIDYPWDYEDQIGDIIDECIEKAINDVPMINKHIERAINNSKIRDESVADILSSVVGDINRYVYIKSYKNIIDELNQIKVEDIQDVLRRFKKENRLTITFGS